MPPASHVAKPLAACPFPVYVRPRVLVEADLPASMIETLEDRIVLSAAGVPVVSTLDGGGTFAAARSVGQRSGSLIVDNALARREFADYFSFSVNTKGNVNLTLSGLTADADL